MLRRTARYLVPYGLGIALRERRQRRSSVSVMNAARAGASGRVPPFDYEAAVSQLVAFGVPEQSIRLGSMPVGSVNFVRDTLARELADRRPLRLLHVGNFVGLSLAAIADAAGRLDDDALVVAVDPDIPHLGVERTQDVTLQLLSHFGLQRRTLVICGYTLEKTVASDGLAIDDDNPLAAFGAQAAPENVLPNLTSLGVRFHAAVLDGSHLGDHARRELTAVAHILEPGGLIFLDDVSDSWVEIRDLYAEVAHDASSPLEAVAHDGRLGVLRVAAP